MLEISLLISILLRDSKSETGSKENVVGPGNPHSTDLNGRTSACSLKFWQNENESQVTHVYYNLKAFHVNCFLD